MKRKCHWLKIENGVSRLENLNAFLSMYYFNSRIVERKAKEKKRQRMAARKLEAKSLPPCSQTSRCHPTNKFSYLNHQAREER